MGRDFHFGRPQNRVQHQLANLVMAPILVKMSTGKTKSPSTVGPFGGPRNMLLIAVSDHGPHGGIAFMRSVIAVRGAAIRDGAQDGGDVLQVRAETHVEI